MQTIDQAGYSLFHVLENGKEIILRDKVSGAMSIWYIYNENLSIGHILEYNGTHYKYLSKLDYDEVQRMIDKENYRDYRAKANNGN